MRIVEKLKVDLGTLAQLTALFIIIFACIISMVIGSMDKVIASLLIVASLFFIIWNLVERKKKLEGQLKSFIKNATEAEKEGQYQSAIHYYEEALSINQKNFEALEGKVKCYLKMQDRDHAITTSKQILSTWHDSAQSYYLLGLCYFEGRLLEEAEEQLNKALKLKFDHLESLLLMGDLQKQNKHPEQAASFYEKYLQLCQDDEKKKQVQEKLESIK